MSRHQKSIWLIIVVGLLVLIWLFKKPVARDSFNRRQMVVESNMLAVLGNTSAPARALIALASTNVAQKVEMSFEKQTQDIMEAAMQWRTPILYYGKVLDESNHPISGVRVSYNTSSINESFTKEQYDSGTVTTDDRGIFKIDGVRGIGMVFQLSHSDYYNDPKNITDFDLRDYPEKGNLPNSEDKALVFYMHSRGDPVPLIERGGGFHAPHDGSIANYPFRGNTRADILGELQVQGWSGLHSDGYPYDWKVQLTVPHGGIIETANYFDFVAPESGYSDTLVFEVSGGENARKTFFVKLPTGFIRFKLNVIMGKDMFISGDYFFNPDGSRNLEPGEVIHPTQ